MALTVAGLTVLSKFPSKRVLSLGYPDILATKEVISSLFNVEPTIFVDNGKWHGIDHELPETVEFFKLIGSEIQCVDVHASRGIETVLDLNYPHDLGKFDMVIDPGTVEHCFNIGQAIINAASAVAEGGVIFHTPPVTMVNHGFYNLNPTLMFDFYMQNGWEVEMACGVRGGEMFEIEPYRRAAWPPECSMYFVARRMNMNALSFPTQTKYLVNPDLKAMH
jgi:hypothetical protein